MRDERSKVHFATLQLIPLASPSLSKHEREPVVTFRFHKNSNGV